MNQVFEVDSTLPKMSSNRHFITVSNPRITNSEILLTLTIKDWNEFLSFYYPLKSIDNISVQAHLLWKFSCNENSIVYCSAEIDIESTSYQLLNLRHWE